MGNALYFSVSSLRGTEKPSRGNVCTGMGFLEGPPGWRVRQGHRGIEKKKNMRWFILNISMTHNAFPEKIYFNWQRF